MKKLHRFRPHLDVLENRTTPATFVLDPSRSCLALSGDIFGSIPIEAQGPGSLLTCYDGAIVATTDLKAMTLDIGYDSLMIAQVSGEWSPGAPPTADCTETAPANYGGRVNFAGEAKASFRDVYLTSYGLLGLQDAGGYFAFDSLQALDVYYGVAAACHPLVGFGETELTGLSGAVGSADAGTLVDLGGGQMELTLRYNITFELSLADIPTRIFVQGEIVGISSEEGGSPAPGSGFGLEVTSLLTQVGEPAEAAPVQSLETLAPLGILDAMQLSTVPAQLEAVTSSLPLHVVEAAVLDFAADWTSW